MDPDQPLSPDESDYTSVPPKRIRAGSDSSASTESCESIHSTRTLRSEDFEFFSENGRLYGNDTYFLPCDEAEQDRMAIQHQVFLHALKQKLTTVPMTSKIHRILDIGTGPGDWAVAMAVRYPYTEVVGVDMTVWDVDTTEGESGAGRVTWELDDLDVWAVPDPSEVVELGNAIEAYDPFHDPTHREPPRTKRRDTHTGEPPQPQSPTQAETASPSTGPSFDVGEERPQPGWHFSEPFDLIHMRNMKGAFMHWEDVYAEIYKNLRPGGYVEVVDYEVSLPNMKKPTSSPESQSPAPQAASTETPAESTEELPFALPICRQLYLLMMSSSFRAGHPLGTYYLHPSYLSDAGFKDVRTTYVNVPVGQWGENPEQRRLGKMFLVVLMESFEANLMRLGTRWGGMSADELRELIEKGKAEILEWCRNTDRGEEDSAKRKGKGKGKGKDKEEERQEWCAMFKWVIGRKPG